MDIFQTYFHLCPISDSNRVIGVTEDGKENHVIVTYEKNLAIIYDVPNQKQIKSWRTKDNFTCPIVFNKTDNNYYVILNKTVLRIWNRNDEYLDLDREAKRLTFPIDIYAVISVLCATFVIFQNGKILPLEEALRRRDENTLQKLEGRNVEISAVQKHVMNEMIYLGLIIKSPSQFNYRWQKFNIKKTNEDYGVETGPKNDFELMRVDIENVRVAGSVLSELNGKPHLFLLWSDKKFYSVDLNTVETTLFSVIEGISAETNAAIVAIDNNYLVFHGANENGEGSRLLAYNLKYKILEAEVALKLYVSNVVMWKAYNYVAFNMGNYLLTVPYNLQRFTLSNILAAASTVKKRGAEVDNELILTKTLNWRESQKKSTEKGHVTYDNVIYKALTRIPNYESLSDADLSSQLITVSIDNGDIRVISACLKYFNDIPSASILAILSFAMQAEVSVFMKHSDHIDVRLIENLPLKFKPVQRMILINDLLMFRVNDSDIVSILQRQMTINETLYLLECIYYLLSDEKHELNREVGDFAFERNLIAWGTFLLDAKYQQLVTSDDDAIRILLDNMSKLVHTYISSLGDMRDVRTKFENIKMDFSTKPALLYSIEPFSFY